MLDRMKVWWVKKYETPEGKLSALTSKRQVWRKFMEAYANRPDPQFPE